MRKNALNVVIFLFLAGAMFFLWQQMEKNVPKGKNEDAKPAAVDDQRKKDEQAKKDADAKPPEKPKEPPKVGPPRKERDRPRPRLVAFGDDTFYNRVLLNTVGGAIQQVVLPRFGQADRLGREVKDASGKTVPLHLIPGVPQTREKYLREPYEVPAIGPGLVADPSILAEPSYVIYHYPTPDDKYPDPLLGEVEWKAAEGYRDAQGAPKVMVHPDGRHEMVFEYELKEHPDTGVPYYLKFRKSFTLGPKDYHVGLRVEISRLPGGQKGVGQLRYQLSGPRGLPIEGEWYTTEYRAAVIGWSEENETPRRQYEDAASIGRMHGGEAVVRGKNTFEYMVVRTQYFASGVAIDESAGGAAHPWSYVRATSELPFGKDPNPNQPYFDDITVRAASEVIDLAPGEAPVVHTYVLYNGPAKVRLLRLMSEERGAVEDALVSHYLNDLSLGTITDFRSDTWLGRFANFIYWTDLVIVFTNLMHWLLAVIHAAIPDWAVAIILLTFMVRLMLFYPSRKQTAMSMRMMEINKKLQPEFEKLQEKYKDDPHTYNREKMRLMMKHGFNPAAQMGGCLLLLAQMPIMMGLYFCLQESVFFRLEPFIWINNLAAPDMTFWWSEKIPFISTPEDLGSFIYMGPYFNLLPVLAVGLMLYQQSKMMPPSTDPQAEQQRMMMKIMMVMMAFFFYKVAAGLALYFTVSTLWGIIERQFIPKPKVDIGGDGGDGAGSAAEVKPQTGSPNGKPATTADAVAAAQQKSKGLLGRLREALQKKMEEMQKRADELSKRQIRNEPRDASGDEQKRRDRDRKKKRRK